MLDQHGAPSGAARDQPLSFHWRGVSQGQLDDLGLPPTGTPRRDFARCAVLANLVVAHASGRWVSYSRDRNHYTGQSRYQSEAYTYQNVLSVVDEFRTSGLIHEERAAPGHSGWQSRMTASAKLIGRLPSLHQLYYSPYELVRLKDGDGRLVGYDDTPRTQRMRRELADLNEALRSVSISLTAADVAWAGIAVRIDGQIVHPVRVEGYRVFNGGWTLGGRLYGTFWQSLPSARRAQLLIDGSAIHEHDFSQLHPRLLYAEFGLEPSGDAYCVDGYEQQRGLVKCAWQIMINAQTRRSGLVALAKELGGYHHQSESAQVLSALEKRHAAISTAFYTSAGRRLQYVDSELLMRIEKLCLSEGIVALPVHDSFIVPVTHSARTVEIMDDELAITLAARGKRRRK